jgi:large subunit ribosomal protein L29
MGHPKQSQEKEMELTKIRNLSDEELSHQEKNSSEQLFRLRFQVSMGQSDGVKKLRELRKEIAQIKTVARERELGIRGEVKEATAVPAAAAETKAAKKVQAAAKPAVAKTPRKAKAPAAAAEKKTTKAKGARK